MQPHLRGLGLENFRVFADYQWFDFAPITILTGPNSSGKSSILKALLLLKDNYEIISSLNLHTPSLNFEGTQHNLSSGINSINSSLGKANIAITLPFNSILSERLLVHYNFIIKSNTTNKIPELCIFYKRQQPLLSVKKNKVYFNFDTFLNLFKKNTTIIKRAGSNIHFFNRKENLLDVFNKFLEFTESNHWSKNEIEYSYGLQSEDGEWLDNDYHFHVMNETISVFSDPESDDSVYSLLFLLFKANYNTEDVDEQLLSDMCNFVFQIIFKIEYGNKIYGTNGYPETNDDEELPEIPSSFADQSLYNKKYENTLQESFHVIKKLEYFPSIKGLSMRAYQPNDDSTLGIIVKKIITKGIGEKEKIFLRAWEAEFSLEPITVERNEKLNVNFILIGGRSLTDIGFGISQLTALLLQIIVAEDNKLLIVEEPESNLHPKFQSMVADLFIDAQKQFGHQFIIETHSEYMIRKFQYLVAKGEMKPEDVVIYYLDDPDPEKRAKGAKQVSKITIESDGSLSDDFGSGFFDEADNLAIQLFQLRKSQRN